MTLKLAQPKSAFISQHAIAAWAGQGKPELPLTHAGCTWPAPPAPLHPAGTRPLPHLQFCNCPWRFKINSSTSPLSNSWLPQKPAWRFPVSNYKLHWCFGVSAFLFRITHSGLWESSNQQFLGTSKTCSSAKSKAEKTLPVRNSSVTE